MDKCFGTFYLPKEEWPAKYGIDTPMAAGMVGQLLYPFESKTFGAAREQFAQAVTYSPNGGTIEYWKVYVAYQTFPQYRQLSALRNLCVFKHPWPRPAIRVEWGTMAFGQSGVPMLNDVA